MTAALAEALSAAAPAGVALARALYNSLAGCIRAAICALFHAQPQEVAVACVLGGDSAAMAEKLSLHCISSVVLPDNESAAAAVRLRVLAAVRARAAGGDALLAALCSHTHLEKTLDAIHTKNRMRRLTGHTKLGEARNSEVAPWSSHTPVERLYVVPCADEPAAQPLQWRLQPAARLPPPARAAARGTAVGRAAPGPELAAASVAAARAIAAEMAAIPCLAGSTCVRLLPPSADWTGWAAYTDCHRCPSDASVHRASVAFLRLLPDRIILRCSSPRHAGWSETRDYAVPGSAAALFSQLLSPPPPPAAAASSSGRRKRKRKSAALFSPDALASIFSPQWAGEAPPAPPTTAAPDARSEPPPRALLFSPATMAKVFSPTWLRRAGR